MLQFITDPNANVPVTDQILSVIDGGGRWIQINMLEASDQIVADVVTSVMPRCIETQSFLLMTDRVELAKSLNVGGVLLTPGADLPSHARVFLGAGAVIGVGIRSFNDVTAVRSLDVDYLCFAPYRCCESGRCGSEPLGITAIRDIISEMQRHDILIPTVAAGGVTYDDIPELIEAGVNGVAVSGAIANADDIAAETNRYIELLRHYERH